MARYAGRENHARRKMPEEAYSRRSRGEVNVQYATSFRRAAHRGEGRIGEQARCQHNQNELSRHVERRNRNAHAAQTMQRSMQTADRDLLDHRQHECC